MKIKKIIPIFLILIIFSQLSFAAGKAVVPSSNQQATPIAGINSSGEMVVVKTDNNGVVSTAIPDEVKVTNPDGSNVGSLTTTTVTGSANANGAFAVTAIDVSAYKTISLQTSGTFNLTQAFEASNDNVNWVPCPMQNIQSVPLAENTSVSGASTGIYSATINFKYFRDRVSAYTSGTISTTLLLTTLAGPMPTQPVQAAQDGTWNFGRTSDYPATATAITAASGNVANASAAATLAGASSKTTYITGFQITAGGATAASIVSATVTGTITGTMTYSFVVPAGVTTAATPLIVTLPKPVPASATNTAIVVTLPALGSGNTNATVNAQGYQL